jgi:hypothetical protein
MTKQLQFCTSHQRFIGAMLKIDHHVSVLPEDAVVLDALDAGSFGARDGLMMYHAILEPEIGNPKADYIVNDGRHILRRTKDVNQIDAGASLLPGGGLGGFEVGVTRHVEDGLQARIHGKHAISLACKVTPDVMAGPRGLVAHADNGNGACVAKHFFDSGWFVHLQKPQ